MFATEAIHTPRISRTIGGGDVSRIAGAGPTGRGAVGFDTGTPAVEQAADATPAASTTPRPKPRGESDGVQDDVCLRGNGSDDQPGQPTYPSTMRIGIMMNAIVRWRLPHKA